MLWIGGLTLPQDGFRKHTTTAVYSIVNQLDTARTVYLERAYKSKVFCGYSINRFIPGGNSYDLRENRYVDLKSYTDTAYHLRS